MIRYVECFLSYSARTIIRWSSRHRRYFGFCWISSWYSTGSFQVWKNEDETKLPLQHILSIMNVLEGA